MTTLTDEAGLLRAIVTDPGDELPRLAYADWLEETGDEAAQLRSEFIRVQIALDAHDKGVQASGVPGSPVWPGYLTFSKRKTLNERMHHLLAGHGHDWLKVRGLATYSSRVGFPVEGWLFKEAGGPGIDVGITVKRGFVEEVRAPLSVLDSPALNGAFEAHPITTVRATNCSEPCVETNGVAHWHLASLGFGPDEKFPTAEAAHAALSLFLVNKAREKAGLPHLPRP